MEMDRKLSSIIISTSVRMGLCGRSGFAYAMCYAVRCFQSSPPHLLCATTKMRRLFSAMTLWNHFTFTYHFGMCTIYCWSAPDSDQWQVRKYTAYYDNGKCGMDPVVWGAVDPIWLISKKPRNQFINPWALFNEHISAIFNWIFIYGIFFWSVCVLFVGAAASPPMGCRSVCSCVCLGASHRMAECAFRLAVRAIQLELLLMREFLLVSVGNSMCVCKRKQKF